MKLGTAVLALLALAFAGCDDGGSADKTAADPAALEASDWVLSDGIDVKDWEQAAPSINFERGQLGGSSGCNAYGGSYEATGSKLQVTDLYSTAMACAPPGMEVEKAFTESLKAASEWAIDGKELRLGSDQGELRFRAASPVGSWRATSILHGNAVKTPLAGSEISADFSAGGGISGSAGCNEYDARYRTASSSIKIELLAVTEVECVSPEGVMEQEAAYLDALPRATDFRIENGGLALLTAQDTVVATFQPRP